MSEHTQNEKLISPVKSQYFSSLTVYKKVWSFFVFPALAISLFIIPQAVAHDLWINISDHFAKQDEKVKAYLGWGHHYPFSDFLSPDRLVSMQVIMPDGKVKNLHPIKEEPGTVIDVTKNGTYVVGAAMKPGYYTKTATGHTFKSKKESRDVISSIWSEKYAKAIFCSVNPTGKSYSKTLGHTLEIIPDNDPCRLTAGDYLTVRVLMRGKPLAGSFVYASCMGALGDKDLGCPVKTDKKGLARVQLVSPGIWRLNIKHQEDPTDPALCDKRVYKAFLTVAVK